MGTFLGLLSAGVAIAFKDYLTNFVAWFYIMLHNPFQIGDRIKINDIKGDVIGIGLLSFSILELQTLGLTGEQSTGRVIFVPNFKLLTDPLINFYSGFKYTWSELHVVVTFSSNWQKAKDILVDIAKVHIGDLSEKAEEAVSSASMKYMIHYTYFTPAVYTDIKEYGILLTLRFLTEPRTARTKVSILNEQILLAFANEGDIHLAYPTHKVIQADHVVSV